MDKIKRNEDIFSSLVQGVKVSVLADKYDLGATRILQIYRMMRCGQQETRPRPEYELIPRNKEIFQEVMSGKSIKETAIKYGISSTRAREIFYREVMRTNGGYHPDTVEECRKLKYENN